MNDAQLHRDLGKVEGELKALAAQVAGMDAKLDGISDYIAQQKGARRATVFISSAASAFVAAVVGWAVSWYAR